MKRLRTASLVGCKEMFKALAETTVPPGSMNERLLTRSSVFCLLLGSGCLGWDKALTTDNCSTWLKNDLTDPLRVN